MKARQNERLKKKKKGEVKQASERIRENEEEELGRNELMPDSVHN